MDVYYTRKNISSVRFFRILANGSSELFSNIAQYAYAPGTGPATVRVETEEDPRAVILTFIDRGIPYNPLAAEDPDITAPAEERSIGGLGVFLVKKTMDDVRYEYREGRNILRILKRI